MPNSRSTERFSNRVEFYIAYRPGYPGTMIDYLRSVVGLTAQHVIADVGSGTGLLSEPFLRNGNMVYGIEPNAPMRMAAEQLLSEFNNFHSIDATAERTALPDASVDMITAGQAFHWFDPSRTKIEFARILKPGGVIALVWNERRETTSPFLIEYEALLQRYGTDYNAINHRNVTPEKLRPFFASHEMIEARFDNFIPQTREQIRGRLLSSSYVPAEGEPGCAEMLAELEIIFERNQKAGVVMMEYDTRLFWG